MAANPLPSDLEKWFSSPEYQLRSLDLSVEKFLEVSDLLLENPNLNSSHLFRADIILDSAHKLKTNAEKEGRSGQRGNVSTDGANFSDPGVDPVPAPVIDGVTLQRTVLRRLIPRNQQLDKPLLQTCNTYELDNGGCVVIYIPHANEDEMPWYHPPVRALAYSLNHQVDGNDSKQSLATLSLKSVPFNDLEDSPPPRLHRTFLSLLNTFVRLAKNSPTAPTRDASPSKTRSTLPSALKDTIIPQHLVQDKYAQLKQKYASDLIARWVEKTEPAKHVFEDIMIAAFLIELWTQMYRDRQSPAFVDVACGNGVLVYILIKEGYRGVGFDARRRKTWDVLEIGDFLDERILIPKPFLDALHLTTQDVPSDIHIHNGIFSPNTFIISNHADELTPWTPILAALSSPLNPLPFLAIPCCSHALSGAKHRYSPKAAHSPSTTINGAEHQSSSGDLKALRAEKAKATTHSSTEDKSMYACLTKKVVAIAEELGFDVEMTLMRIPSTRNIGIVGNRRRFMEQQKGGLEEVDGEEFKANNEDAERRILNLIERECEISGGITASASAWIEGAKKLQTGKGRGKVNLGYKPSLEK